MAKLDRIIKIKDINFVVEVVSTPTDTAKGLSGRAGLKPRTGMFFILSGPTQFWMRDMKFPLDIVWIGSTGKIVDITKDAKPPAPDTPMWLLPLYSSRLPAKYALEINAGEADSFQLSIGDNVTYN